MNDRTIRVALVGYGRMGRMLEALAPKAGCEIALRLRRDDNVDGAGLTQEALQGVDAAIEFSTPESVVPNVERLCELGVKTVVGATGWEDRKERVRQAAERSGNGVVYGANFSIGVNAFYRIVQTAAGLLARIEAYDAGAYEAHHKQKKDAPSGTMLRLLDLMRTAGYERAIDVAHHRLGRIPGTHEIAFDSEADTIQLRHTARSREGFALGALQAARWIVDKKGFFEFSDVWEQMF